MLDAIYKDGIELILKIQQLSPALDMPFKAVTFLGSEPFFLLILPFIYWCVDRSLGARLAILFLISSWINSAVKVWADQPRPFEYDSRVQAIMTESGAGFPSGHTQASLVIWFYLAYNLKKTWFWVVVVFLMLAVPFSRLYLGVHFHTDLAGGYIIGAVILAAFIFSEKAFIEFFNTKGSIVTLAVIITTGTALIFLTPGADKNCIASASTLMGMGIGFVFERRLVRFSPSSSIWKRIVGYLIGIFVVFALWGGLKAAFVTLQPENIFRFIRYCLVGLWCGFGAPWVFVKISLAGKE